jgi:hypothetical protein
MQAAGFRLEPCLEGRPGLKSIVSCRSERSQLEMRRWVCLDQLQARTVASGKNEVQVLAETNTTDIEPELQS